MRRPAGAEASSGPSRVLSRAALLFVGAATIAACEKEGAPVNAPTNEGSPRDPNPTPPAPTVQDAGQSQTQPQPPQHPNPVALYGVPPIDEGEGSKP